MITVRTLDRPAARTPDGRLSPALFNPAPRTSARPLSTLASHSRATARSVGAPCAASSVGGALSTVGGAEQGAAWSGSSVRPVFVLIHEYPLGGCGALCTMLLLLMLMIMPHRLHIE